MATIPEIERLARSFAEKRASLNDLLNSLQIELDALKRSAMPGIRRKATAMSEAHSALAEAVDSSRELFRSPRTITVDGVKVGLQKNPGRVVFDDPAKVVELIRKRLPGDVDRLINVSYTPIRAELAQLSAADLGRIGCELADTGDAVLIKPTASEVDKLVDALLRDLAKVE